MTTKNLEIPTPERVPAELLLRHSTPAQSWQLATPRPILRLMDMSPYRPSRREFLIGAGSLLVLAPFGCGGEERTGSNARTSGETRTVEHALGKTETPADPRRIVVLDAVTLGHVLALDAKPVGYPLEGGYGVPPHLEDRAEGVASVGQEAQPNLEKIAALDPDLIVAWRPFVEENYEKLSQIAPTVATTREGFGDWKADLRFVVEVLGRTDRAEEVLAEYDAHVKEVRAALGDRIDDLEVSSVRLYDDGTYRIMTSNAFDGSVLADVGIRKVLPQRVEAEYGFLDISVERIPDMDGDVIFIISDAIGITSDDAEERATSARAARERVEENPLWQRLEAVQAGRVYEVSVGHWYQGSAPAAHRLLEDLEKYLLGEEQEGR